MSFSTTNVRLDDSPLHGSAAASPVTAPPTPLAAGDAVSSRSGADREYAASPHLAGDDEALLDAQYRSQWNGERGHRTRPSGAWLLGGSVGATGGVGSGTSADDYRQRRLRSYELNSARNALSRLAGSWRRWKALADFVDRNNGELDRLAPDLALQAAHSAFIAGLLLIALSQLGFAIVNTCVKLLERDINVPVSRLFPPCAPPCENLTNGCPCQVWEVIVIRMSITLAGCWGCTSFAVRAGEWG